jgi:DNA-binding NtrC family response regulator
LRVVEDGCVTPVGAVEPRRVDVRVIAATNADLAARIAAGSFRQDLFFRLARYPLATPPLRERLEDVPLLAARFLNAFAADMGRPAPDLSPAASAALQQYRFPGNIRELKNIIERALIASGGEPILPEHLFLSADSSAATQPGTRPNRAEMAAKLPLNLAAAEDALIQRALDETGGNIAEAARLLGVHRTRIYRKLAQEESAAA